MITRGRRAHEISPVPASCERSTREEYAPPSFSLSLSHARLIHLSFSEEFIREIRVVMKPARSRKIARRQRVAAKRNAITASFSTTGRNSFLRSLIFHLTHAYKLHINLTRED